MICEVCKKKIKDKFFLKIHDKFMHIKCLKNLDNIISKERKKI